MGLFKAIERRIALEKDIKRQAEHRSKFSDWANERCGNADCFTMFDHTNRNESIPPDQMMAFLLAKKTLYESSKEYIRNLYEYIYQKCPKVKKHIDNKIKKGSYDIDDIKIAIVTHGIFLLRAADYMMNDGGATKEKYMSFLSCYRVSDIQAKEMYDQSNSDFENFVAHLESKNGGTKFVAADYYKNILSYIIDSKKSISSSEKTNIEDELKQISSFCESLTLQMIDAMCKDEMTRQQYMASRGTPCGSILSLDL